MYIHIILDDYYSISVYIDSVEQALAERLSFWPRGFEP